ncbi:Protein vav [Frankliniella fusca]|uniref:Protein vav n=1 Tax=Frankliniella fusca TaxID=407009 RepID=A0AAE1HFP3_9NEOP|nr:Protein vav [Frankliniella fusca]
MHSIHIPVRCCCQVCYSSVACLTYFVNAALSPTGPRHGRDALVVRVEERGGMELALAGAGAGAAEVWRDCASWLTRCEALRPDHKANWADASVSDLAYTLRDGVLLCNLLNSLDPGCIEMKDVNQKPQMAQFLCLRNIKAFLQVCHDHFGIKKTELFEPLHLFDLSDFFRVLHTLSKLSNCPRIQRKNIPGFSFKPRSLSQEDIYRNLHANLETPSDPDITPAWDTWRTVPWLQFTIPCPKFGEVEEELYADLFCVTFCNEVPTEYLYLLVKLDICCVDSLLCW